MVTTLIPLGARSRAIGRVIPAIAAVDAAYAACPISPSNAIVDDVLTITPLCPSELGSFLPITPDASRIALNVPIVLT